MTLFVKPRTVALALGLVAACFVAIYLAGLVLVYGLGHDRLLGLIPVFSLAEEGNPPTLYSSLLLLLCAALLSLIAAASRRKRAPGVAHWFGLSFVFLFLAADETFAIHERLSEPLRLTLNTSGVLYFGWILPYAAATLLLALIYIPFLWRLPRATLCTFCVAGAAFVTGALLLELVSGFLFDPTHYRGMLPLAILVAFEEALEMFGSVLFIYGLLSYIGSEFGDLRLGVSGGSAR